MKINSLSFCFTLGLLLQTVPLYAGGQNVFVQDITEKKAPVESQKTSTVAIAPPAVNHIFPADLTDRLTIEQVKVFGQANNTHWKLLSTSEKGRTYLVVFGKNDDVLAGLYKFLDDTKIESGSFTAIGAVGAVALGFYRPQDHTYTVTKVEQAELCSMTGNIGIKNGKGAVHTHAVFSVEDGHCLGGHVFYASAWPTIEMTVIETKSPATRQHDDESGLWLYDLH